MGFNSAFKGLKLLNPL